MYFFVTGQNEVALVNAQSKASNEPSAGKIEEVAEILLAYRQGAMVLEG